MCCFQHLVRKFDTLIQLNHLSEHGELARERYVREGNGGSKEFIRQLAQSHPTLTDVQAFRALSLIETGDLSGARATLHRFADKGCADYLGVASQLESHLHNKEQRTVLYEEGCGRDPTNYFVLQAARSVFLGANDFESLRREAERAVALWPEDAELFSQLTTVFYLSGELHMMQAALKGAPTWFKASAQFYASSGKLAFARHDMREMEREYLQAVATCSGSSSNWSYLSVAQAQLGKLVDAERSAGFALDVNPREPLAIGTLAKVCRLRGEEEKFRTLHQRQLTIAPNLKPFDRSYDANVLLSKGDLKGALIQLREQAKSLDHLTAAGAERLILKAFIKSEKWKEAREQLEKVRSLRIHKCTDDLAEARIALAEGDRLRSVEILRCAEADETVPTDFYPSALEIFLKIGDDSEVHRLLNLFYEGQIGNDIPYWKASKILEEAKRPLQSKQVLEAGLRTFPSSLNLRLLQYQRVRIEDPARASHLYQELPVGIRPGKKVDPFDVLTRTFKGLINGFRK